MEVPDLQFNNIQVKIDVGLIETTLNTNLNKIVSSLRLLQAQLLEQQTQLLEHQTQHSHLQHKFQTSEGALSDHNRQMEVFRENSDNILKEVSLKRQDQMEKVSRISSLEAEMEKIKDSLKLDSQRGSGVGGRSENEEFEKRKSDSSEKERKSEIRIQRRNTREASKDGRLGSKGYSRKSIRVDVEQQGSRIESSPLQSMEESRVQKGGNSKIKMSDRKKTEQSLPSPSQNKQAESSQSEANEKETCVKSQIPLEVGTKLKLLEVDYNKRLQILQKKSGIFRGVGSTTAQPHSSSSSTTQTQESSEQEPPVDPLKLEFQAFQQRFKESNTQIKKIELQQKQHAKRMGDIMIKFQKNQERSTAALKYLQKNFDKLSSHLRDLDILNSTIDLQEQPLLNTRNNSEKGSKISSRISKLLNIKQSILPNTNMADRVDTMDSLVKNIDEQLREIKTALKKIEGKGLLPRIDDKENVTRLKEASMDSNILHKVNLKLVDLEAYMDKTKVQIKSLSQRVNDVPLKLLELQAKVREQGEIREQRLVQLIKQLITRALTDPFNSNFTNSLKKQINIKFLQIKHEYVGILKEIEKKVEDRADRKELEYLIARYETTVLEMKSIIAKKTDVEDSKKWNKFMEAKMKELLDAVKVSEINQSRLVQEHTLSIRKKA